MYNLYLTEFDNAKNESCGINTYRKIINPYEMFYVRYQIFKKENTNFSIDYLFYVDNISICYCFVNKNAKAEKSQYNFDED